MTKTSYIKGHDGLALKDELATLNHQILLFHLMKSIAVLEQVQHEYKILYDDLNTRCDDIQQMIDELPDNDEDDYL